VGAAIVDAPAEVSGEGKIVAERLAIEASARTPTAAITKPTLDIPLRFAAIRYCTLC